MKKITKSISYFLIAVLFSIALSGCTNSQQVASKSTNIVIWSFEDEDIWKPIEKEFLKENKGYTITYQKQSLDSSYENRVLNSILSGNGPDVWSMPDDWVYRHKDQLYPMPSTMAATNNINSTFVPAIKNSVYFDNKVYALSPDVQPLMVYYNQGLFNTALDSFNNANKGDANRDARTRAGKLLGNGVPGTWTDFADAVKLLTQKQGNNITLSGVAMGTDKITNSADLLYLLMLQNQTQILSDNLQLATFNLPNQTPLDTSVIPGKNALNFYTSFADPKNPNYSWNDSMGNDIDAFVNGKAAMIFGYSELATYLSAKYPDFKFQKAYMPQVGQTGIEPDHIIDYAKFNAFGVSILSKNPAVAWNLVNILTNVNDGDYNSALRLTSSKKANSYEITMANRNGSNPEKLELATAATLVKGRYPDEFDTQIKNMIYAVNHGIQDSQSALDLSANNITGILRRTGW